MARAKDVLTTGEVARICKVAPRTVSKWFDAGQLRGYRIPGSKDRRIPLDQLVRFMRVHGIPLNGLETGMTRVLLVDDQSDLVALLTRALSEDANYDVRQASNTFEAGAAAEQSHPHVILISVDLPGLNVRELVRSIRGSPELGGTKLIAVAAGSRNGQDADLLDAGFDAVLRKPFEVAVVVRAIEDAVSGQPVHAN